MPTSVDSAVGEGRGDFMTMSMSFETVVALEGFSFAF